MTDDPRPIRVERNYHADGSLREEVHYRGSSSHGPWRLWHLNGVLAREYFYDKHVLADGTHRTWFSNGKLESELVVRGSRQVSEVWYGRHGRRVASPMDKCRLRVTAPAGWSRPACIAGSRVVLGRWGGVNRSIAG